MLDNFTITNIVFLCLLFVLFILITFQRDICRNLFLCYKTGQLRLALGLLCIVCMCINIYIYYVVKKDFIFNVFMFFYSLVLLIIGSLIVIS